MEEKKRILFVDDEADIAKLVTFFLRKKGFEVAGAQDGKEALSLARNKPDLILLDLLLPDMDGYEVCRRIKDDPDLKNIPVIIFTASATDITRLTRKAKEAGAKDYIIKPFSDEELLEKINRYIDKGER